MIENH